MLRFKHFEIETKLAVTIQYVVDEDYVQSLYTDIFTVEGDKERTLLNAIYSMKEKYKDVLSRL